ncbi:MAG TPA: hypothetical protein VM689_09675 [Aliidongia sp.]|nr:hypothetical protein [Aliidongia sp.]
MSTASPPAGSSFVPVVPRRRIWVPMLAAFAVEALIAAAILLWLAQRPPLPAASPQFGPIRLDLTKLPTLEPAATAPPSSAAASEAAPAKPVPEAVKPVPETAKPAPEQPMREFTPAARPDHRPPPPHAAPKPPPLPLPDLSLLPAEEAAAAGPLRPAPPKGNGQAIDVSEFMRQVDETLHKAAHDMNVLRGIKLTGRVVLAVHYRDRRAWDPKILKSSGFPILDKAVADAVALAVWPPPPPGLEGREIIIPITGWFW